MTSYFWQRLKAARKNARLTQAQCAASLGLSRSGYAFWEDDNDASRTNPTAQQVAAFCNLTKTPIDWLLNDDSEVSWTPLEKTTSLSVSSAVKAPSPDRICENFWRAVEYTTVTAAPDTDTAFYVPISTNPIVTADFTAGRNLVLFASNPNLDSLLTHAGKLFVLEAASKHRMTKHLLVWCRGGTDGVPDMTAELERLQVNIRYLTTVDEAAAFLLALS